jgi:hypothetical protein
MRWAEWTVWLFLHRLDFSSVLHLCLSLCLLTDGCSDDSQNLSERASGSSCPQSPCTAPFFLLPFPLHFISSSHTHNLSRLWEQAATTFNRGLRLTPSLFGFPSSAFVRLVQPFLRTRRFHSTIFESLSEFFRGISRLFFSIQYARFIFIHSVIMI